MYEVHFHIIILREYMHIRGLGVYTVNILLWECPVAKQQNTFHGYKEVSNTNHLTDFHSYKFVASLLYSQLIVLSHRNPARYSTNIGRSDLVETAKENRVRFPVGVVTDNMADPLVRSDRPSFYAEVYPFISLETNNIEKASNCTCSYTASID